MVIHGRQGETRKGSRFVYRQDVVRTPLPPYSYGPFLTCPKNYEINKVEPQGHFGAVPITGPRVPFYLNFSVSEVATDHDDRSRERDGVLRQGLLRSLQEAGPLTRSAVSPMYIGFRHPRTHGGEGAGWVLDVLREEEDPPFRSRVFE